jgi:hypothetical protein
VSRSAPGGGVYGTLLSMAISAQGPDNQIRLEVRPALGDVELNELLPGSCGSDREHASGVEGAERHLGNAVWSTRARSAPKSERPCGEGLDAWSG